MARILCISACVKIHLFTVHRTEAGLELSFGICAVEKAVQFLQAVLQKPFLGIEEIKNLLYGPFSKGPFVMDVAGPVLGVEIIFLSVHALPAALQLSVSVCIVELSLRPEEACLCFGRKIIPFGPDLLHAGHSLEPAAALGGEIISLSSHAPPSGLQNAALVRKVDLVPGPDQSCFQIGIQAVPFASNAPLSGLHDAPVFGACCKIIALSPDGPPPGLHLIINIVIGLSVHKAKARGPVRINDPLF